MRKLLKKQGFAPDVLVTDKLLLIPEEAAPQFLDDVAPP